MTEQEKVPERSRRDWIIILIILLIGFLCVIVAGQWAIRFSPTWKLDTDMGSNIDPNSIFLTSRPNDFFEPLDPSILTQPVWIDVFLTPGASFLTNEPGTPLPTNTPLTINTPIPTAIVSPTSTAIIPSPTNTIIYFPPPTNTPKPPSTNTPVPPSLSADLSITKNDGVTIVNNGDTVTYTVRVSNSGPGNVTGAILSDAAASGLTKTSVVCSPTPGQCITPPTIGQIEGGTFALPTINSGQFYEISITADVTASSGSISNVATVSVPAGVSDPNTGNNSVTDTDVMAIEDLSITKTDWGTEYSPSGVVIYTITVTNTGTIDLTNIALSDPKPGQITDWLWYCNKLIPACLPQVLSGDYSNSFDLVAGDSIVFTAFASISGSPSGNLVNTATVTTSGLNRSATDTDTLDSVEPEIGPPDGGYAVASAGSPITIDLGAGNGIPFDNTNPEYGYDFVYYERWYFDSSTGTTEVQLDCIQVQVSADSSTWYTVLYWCDDPSSLPDTNSNIDITSIGGTEYDNRSFPPPPLYANPLRPDIPTGVTIDIDAPLLAQGAASGNYRYIRFIQPTEGGSDGPEIDSIEIFP